MKKLLTTLIIIFTLLSCKAQEIDIVSGYDTTKTNQIIDSLHQIINNLRLINEILVSGQISDTAIRDTFQYFIKGITDSTLTTIDKKGQYIKTVIKEGDKRITSIYDCGARRVFFMNDEIYGDSIYSYTEFQYNTDSLGRSGLFYFKP